MRPRDTDFLFRSDNAFASSQSGFTGIPEILGALRRRWRLVAFGALSGMTLAATYIALAPTLYTSSVRVFLDTTMNQNLQAQKIVEDRPFDTFLVDSQVQIISSESIILPVIKSMNLTHDREFVGPPKSIGAQILWQFYEFTGRIKNALSSKQAPATGSDTLPERTAVEGFLKRLAVKRGDLTYVIDIAFESEEPDKAARIANAIADSYIAATLEAKSSSARSAGQWLQSRLVELKAQASDADQALQRYKIENNIVDTSRGLLTQEQLSDLNTQLISARIATAEAKARLDRIRQIVNDGIPDATVADALNNSVITRLRAQYLDASERAAGLISRLGSTHYTVVKVHEQMAVLRESIRDEEQRIADAYASDYEIALARERSLADTLSGLLRDAAVTSQALVKMREHESSADVTRNLYNSFLQKFQEMMQAQTIPITNARVITKATPPLHKSSPKDVAALAAGLVLGLVMGAGIVIGRELFADVFRTPGEVEQTTGIRCLGVLPIALTIGKRQLRSGRKAPPRQAIADTPVGIEEEGIEEFVLEAPFSRFAETIRNVKISIDADRRSRDVKVIGVVSSVAREGKTTVAANLGAFAAGSSGARCLLIDGDFHQRSLTSKLAPDAREGLIEVLGDPSRLAEVVRHRSCSLDVLPCVVDTRIPNAAELLGSSQMQDLLAATRQFYDYIIIELPPIVSVVDVKVIERFIDSFVLVVEWGRSKRSLVLEALSEVQMIRERLVGIVLNKADPFALRSLESYKGDAFSSYYEG
jgi:succinoglycan biosynthesis transport protein ExoP